jgi:hypothetical protein
MAIFRSTFLRFSLLRGILLRGVAAISLMSLISSGTIAAPVVGNAVDFSSTAGVEGTCRDIRPLAPGKLVRDDERIVFALCSGIALLRDGARWWRETGTQPNQDWQDRAAIERIRARLEDFLVRIRTARQALEGVRGAGPYLRIEPGKWEIDLDGDGTVTPQEKYFFWIPKRGVSAFPAFQSATATTYYETHFIQPVIRVDRSDVYWAVAYCHFTEAVLNLVLSYDVHSDQDGQRIELKDRGRIAKIAYRNLLDGLRYSTGLREMLALETDDDAEWIANPKQVNTSFPLVMDEQTFTTWGALLGHLDKLVHGQTLLGGGTSSRDFPAVRDLTMGVCQPGEGINLRTLFLDPIRQPLDSAQWRARCVKPDNRLPFSGLAQLIAGSIERNSDRSAANVSGEWMILRHLYWVN